MLIYSVDDILNPLNVSLTCMTRCTDTRWKGNSFSGKLNTWDFANSLSCLFIQIWAVSMVYSASLFLVLHPGNNITNNICNAHQNKNKIALQAFNWESHKHDWWRNLERKIPDIAKSGFTSAWLPPPTHSFSPQGQKQYSVKLLFGFQIICFFPNDLMSTMRSNFQFLFVYRLHSTKPLFSQQFIWL